jgi:hypothetical protein
MQHAFLICTDIFYSFFTRVILSFHYCFIERRVHSRSKIFLFCLDIFYGWNYFWRPLRRTLLVFCWYSWIEFGLFPFLLFNFSFLSAFAFYQVVSIYLVAITFSGHLRKHLSPLVPLGKQEQKEQQHTAKIFPFFLSPQVSRKQLSTYRSKSWRPGMICLFLVFLYSPSCLNSFFHILT